MNNRIQKAIGFLAAFALLGHIAYASSLGGRVFDDLSGVALDGVVVKVDGTDRTTVTRLGGEWRFSDLVPGTYSVTFRSIGFEPMTETIEVGSSESSSFDARLEREYVELEGVTVRASIIGQARALNAQKTNPAYSNVVAADEIGRFPDQNAAEALSRLPGVSVERDQGEGRFVIVRGIDPNLNSVSLNGVKLASPSVGERATLLDTIPSDTLQQVEVYKSTVPSQPGDSVGGYINIKTPSAFDHEAAVGRFGYQFNYSDLVGEWEGKFTGAFGATSEDGKFGFMINASHEERTFGSDNNEADPWTEEDGEDASSGFVTEAVELREYDLTRTRLGLSSNLEFKPSDSAYYFLRASWNDFEDTEVRNAAVIEQETFTGITDSSFIGVESEVVREIKDRTEAMKILAFSFGGENRVNNTDIDYAISISRAEEDTPYDFEAIYEFDDTADIRFSNTQGSILGIQQVGGDSDLMDASIYAFDEIVVSNQLVEEEDRSAEFNVTHNFSNDGFKKLKWGGLFREKEKTSNLDEFENDDNPSAVDTLDGFLYSSPRDAFGNGLPMTSPSISTYFQANESAFAMEMAEDASALEDFVSNEDIFAAYLEAHSHVNGWELVWGARFEDTDFSTSGFEYNDDTEEITAATGSNSYSHFLPGFHAKKEIGEDTLFRFSWNNTIARPLFDQTIPFAEIEGDEVTIGNPGLDPLESMNFDVSVEKYTEGLGILSAAIFYKDVENFIYEQTGEGDFRDITDAEITTFLNGPSGEILGLELSAQQQLSFLPGFGTYFNITFVDSEATALPAEDGDPLRVVPFIKQSDVVGNAALTYDREGFFFRIAGTWRSEYLDEIGESPEEDRFIDDHFQVDISARYQVNPHWTVFANWLNVTDEPLSAYFGESNRLSQYELYGWSANTGFSWTY